VNLKAEIKAELESESTHAICGPLGQHLANVRSTSQCSVLCKPAASCGTPQLIQQSVEFKDLIACYLLLPNKLVDPELLSNVLGNWGFLPAKRSEDAAEETCSARSGLECFVGAWQSVTGKLHQVLSRLHLLSGDVPDFSLVFPSPPHSFQKNVFIPMEYCQQPFCSSTAEPPQKLPRTLEIALVSIFKSFLCQQN